MIYRSYKAEGIVLKRINIGEKDKLLTIFTKNLGKIVLIAKGIRSIHSKKAPHLELFTHTSFFAANGRNLDILTEAYTKESFMNLRTDLEKVAFAYSIAEILDRLCAERQEHKNIFDFLLITLRKLNKAENQNIREIIDEFTLHTLWDLGYLVRGKLLERSELQGYLAEVMEKNLKSDSLLTKINSNI
ncbi:DNA repair protein RecO [Candidatus Gottesmanbacteria bacterium]|nr:DNA repair protein RecO [Candidatus Gottesmanbacteria bacterium]